MRVYERYFLLFSFLIITVGTDAATLFVTTLADGVPGSLRATIVAASGGDTIQFSVAGTIVLNEALGELVVDKQLIIDGQNKIIVDGDNQINICFHITNTGTADASNSVITNIAIQNFTGHDVDPGSGTASQELPAYGVLIDGGAEDCSVVNATITNIHSGIDQEAAGIRGMGTTSDMINNTISAVSSEDNPAGDTGDVFGINSASIDGDCSNNTIFNLTTGSAGNISGLARSIIVSSMMGDCSNNTIYTVTTGEATFLSGPAYGIFISLMTGACSGNTIYDITTGNSSTFGGTIRAIFINTMNGDCSDNTIHTLITGNAGDMGGLVLGISVLTSTGGDYINNTIHDLVPGTYGNQALYAIGMFVDLFGNCRGNVITDISATSGGPVEQVGGIKLSSANDSSLIECNTVLCVTGGDEFAFGISIAEANNVTINNNVIDSVENNSGAAHGLRLGDEAVGTDVSFVTNSLVSCNIISAIQGTNKSGFGITVTGSGSVGNDLLHNSIFDINGGAISILTISDARISLQSVSCFDGCKLTIKGALVPLIFGTGTGEFLVQFFVSDSNSPSQTKTFIGEVLLEAGTFKIKFVPAVPVTFGQFITATATALPLGSQENNNTSEVSNALAVCKPNSTFCPCPEMVPDETCVNCASN